MLCCLVGPLIIILDYNGPTFRKNHQSSEHLLDPGSGQLHKTTLTAKMLIFTRAALHSGQNIQQLCSTSKYFHWYMGVFVTKLHPKFRRWGSEVRLNAVSVWGDFPSGCYILAHSAAPAQPSIRVKWGVWTKFPIIPLYGAAMPGRMLSHWVMISVRSIALRPPRPKICKVGAVMSSKHG